MFEQSSDAQLKQILKTGYKLTPATLGHRITKGEWIPARHLLHISKIVAPAIARGKARIIVTMPPRHGKSEYTSIHTPTWFLEKWPKKRVILSTYGAELSTDFSRRIRDQILECPPELSVRLKEGSQKVDRFHTTKGGALYAVGIGGATTGRGGDLILIDDYIKNSEDSFSEVVRQKIWDWFQSVAFTRLEPGGSMIILATRWHVDDLIGRVLTNLMGWTEIRLPAIAEEDDPLGRAEGEALWPLRYDLEALLEIKEVLGTYWFNSMYQQHPISTMLGVVTGDMIKTIRKDEMPHQMHLNTMRTWDFAASDGKGDYSAGPLVHYQSTTRDWFISEMPHFQKSPKGTQTIVENCAKRDGTHIPIWIEQEPGSAGKIVIDHYSSDVLPDYSVRGLRPTGPLAVRATPFLAAVEAGKVHIVEGKWNKKLRDEVDAFPEGKNDDQIAALAMAFERLSRGTNKSVIWGETLDKMGFRPATSCQNVNGVVW